MKTKNKRIKNFRKTKYRGGSTFKHIKPSFLEEINKINNNFIYYGI